MLLTHDADAINARRLSDACRWHDRSSPRRGASWCRGHGNSSRRLYHTGCWRRSRSADHGRSLEYQTKEAVST